MATSYTGDPLYILAYDHERAERVARRLKVDPREWHSVDNMQQLQAIKSGRILFGGDCYFRTDYAEMKAYIDSHPFKVFHGSLEENKRENWERKLQIAAVNWLKMALTDWLVISIPNEQGYHAKTDEEKKQQMIRMELLKKMGLRPGAADLLLFGAAVDPGTLRVVALETKWEMNGQNDNQIQFEKDWKKIGGEYFVYRSLEELYQILLSQNIRPACPPPIQIEDSKHHIRLSFWAEAGKPDPESMNGPPPGHPARGDR